MRRLSDSVLALVRKQLAEGGQVGATNFEKMPDLAVAVPAATGLTSPGEATPNPLVFLEPGIVIAMYGQERLVASQFKMANVEIRLQLNGQWDLIRSGQSSSFAYFPFLGLFGPNMNWTPIIRRVERDDVWQAYYRNFDTGATAYPTIGFSFLSDREVEKMMSGQR